jgi:hypothetical protein
MLSYFIDYNKERFEEKTFMDMVEVTKLVAEWKKSQVPKTLVQIERIVTKNRKLQDLLKKNINTRNYEKLYFAKKFVNTEDIPENGDVLRREESQVYSWTHSSKFAVTVSDYQNGPKKPKTGGIIAVSKNVKKEEILLDTYNLLNFIEEIFSEVDESDLKTFLKKVQAEEYDKDTVIDFLYSYHKLEEFAKKEQEILVSGNSKNNKCSVIAWYKHEDGIFKEEGWGPLVKN